MAQKFQADWLFADVMDTGVLPNTNETAVAPLTERNKIISSGSLYSWHVRCLADNGGTPELLVRGYRDRAMNTIAFAFTTNPLPDTPGANQDADPFVSANNFPVDIPFSGGMYITFQSNVASTRFEFRLFAKGIE